MSTPTTKQIVDKLIDDYRRTASVLRRTHRRQDTPATWMNGNVFDKDADDLADAFKAGKFHPVSAADVPELEQKYGAQDIYHLTATYFNATGEILQVQ